ncbi:MAG: hypothetical protein ACE5PV_24735 [Candidatus Poribacteria bacterium]
MRNILLTMAIISLIGLPVVFFTSCGEEKTVSKPTPTPKTEPETISEPPVIRKSAVPEGVVFFEAEDFDQNKSVMEKGAVKWHVKDDEKAYGKKYVTPTGASRKGETELVYQIPEIKKSGRDWKLWMRVIFPKAGGEAADSFFWDLSLDGKKWPGKNEVIAGESIADWQWRGWKMRRKPDKGKDNWFKLLERESDIKVDVICLRSDGKMPDDAEYEAYLKVVGQ